ncbi:substrate-binding domain-containing protein [Clostridium cellulovorans]|uniref:Periplasmic binding protein/LacI transcriptional regulator n=1 Tax=Clostridium cellulovorans (strain ATCC 35296 / DSM 3052 / OCM 3 / 743B) TaxID=573061 RepID=D9SKT8_CLOC7|nr:substrate-binding domain-containing protein [Clostridium cellulovorans]ADL53510.1 periplasmic binding protein/LacI transcriptional regulator [Clostridium cellulovorans 743B]
MKIKINFNIKWIIFIALLISIIVFPFYYQKRISTQNEKIKNISLILLNQSDDYWKNVKLGAETAAKEFDIKLNIVAPEDGGDITIQQNLINEAVAMKVDALLLVPSSFQELVEPVEAAVNKGIIVMTVDSKVNTAKIACCIATDNLSAGKSAGEKLVSLARMNSVAAIVGFDKKTGSNEFDRYKGIKEVTKDYKEIQVIDRWCDIKDSNGAERIAKELISNNEDISVIIALNYKASIGVARAIEKLGLKGKIKVVAFDGDYQEVKYMEDGTIQSVVIQSPFSMGYLAVKNAVLKLQGKSIPRYIESGFTVIDNDAIYLPENQKILFPFTQ